jgi:hypothetical protein
MPIDTVTTSPPHRSKRMAARGKRLVDAIGVFKMVDRASRQDLHAATSRRFAQWPVLAGERQLQAQG